MTTNPNHSMEDNASNASQSPVPTANTVMGRVTGQVVGMGILVHSKNNSQRGGGEDVARRAEDGCNTSE